MNELNQTEETTIFSNLTVAHNTTTATPRPTSPDLFVTVLTYIDEVNRVLATIIFLVYFILVAIVRELRSRNLLYVHHANLVGFFFVLMYMIYFNSSSPPTSDPLIIVPFCTTTEAIWGLLKYLRSYSVVLIALYRFLAVFYTEFFKKINKSYLNIMIPVVLIWFLSAALFVATKFGFNTTYGALYCIDGYSTKSVNTIEYLVVSSILAILVPFAAITVIYVLIKRRLDQTYFRLKQKAKLSSKTSRDESYLVSTINNNQSTKTGDPPVRSKRSASKVASETSKNQRFNIQLISLNICYLICFTMSFILSFRYIIPDFNAKFYYFRQILRVLNIFFQAMIPVCSLYFNPYISFQKIKQSFKSTASKYTK